MLRHIVLFKLKPFGSMEEKKAQLELIKQQLEALPKEISAISKLSVYFNENPLEDYDFMLETEVASLEDLPQYADHPAHLRVAKEYIKPYVERRACVDVTIG